MADHGIVRVIGRELFGLAVRLTGLWLVFMSGFTFCTLVVGNFHQEGPILWSLIGILVGLWMILRADAVCRRSYGRQDAAEGNAGSR